MGNNLKNNLYGLGINLNIRPFKYFKIDYCRRYNDNAANNWQTTVVWGLPFSIGQEKFLYDGFIDKTTSNRDFAASLNFTSQLKWLLSPHLKIKNKLYLGIEYVYWDNKFGIKNTEAFKTDERNINILLKYHF
jgi:nucleoside-specific outer membrane channel protein Tsx